jgi:hypothetical protein
MGREPDDAEPGPAPDHDAAPTPPTGLTPDHDAARRAFFRQFGRQAISTAGQVAGMATIVNRVTGTAMASLLGLAEPPRSAPAGVLRGPDVRSGVVSTPSTAAGLDRGRPRR